MRDLSEININRGGRPVDTPPPSIDDIQSFQEHFDLNLPDSYLRMLAHANGGHPEMDSFNFENCSAGSNVDKFFHLTADHDDDYSVWSNTEFLREVLERDGLVAIGQNGGGDVIFLDLSNDIESVHILYQDEENATPKITDSFEAFIDSLYLNPDYI